MMSYIIILCIFSTGRDLLSQLTSDDSSGFQHHDDAVMTSDHLNAVTAVRRAVEPLEYKLDVIQENWQKRERELSHTVQFGELEITMKTVSYSVIHTTLTGWTVTR